MPQQLHSKRAATPGKAGKLFFPQARDVDMLNDGFQAAIYFKEEPSGQLTQGLLKERLLGTPA